MRDEGQHVWPVEPPTRADRDSYADAVPRPFWLDRDRPSPCDPLEGRAKADLVIVGGGLTGLWAAVLAKEFQVPPAELPKERERTRIWTSVKTGK